MPIEESHKINIEGGSNEGARMPIRGSNPREDRLGASRPVLTSGPPVGTEPAVRSATSHTSAKADGTYDVAIIGAGCIGAAVARELSKTMASVVLLEGADDVCQGATKGNSGIVHAGYDDKPGSTRARLCWKGNQMFPALDEDLHFGYQLTGSLVVARGAKEEEHLQELYQRGQTNGVKNLRIVGTEELRQMEPTLDEECTAALLSPDAGTLIPYEYTIALAENAADNGVEVRTRRMTKGITRNAEGLLEVSMDHWEPKEWVEQQAGLGNYFGGEGEGGPWENFPQLLKQKQKVTVEDMKVGGSGSMRAMGGVTVGSETIKARYVVNCAGGASDKIANMVGDESFKIKPRLGEYVRQLVESALHPVRGQRPISPPGGSQASRRSYAPWSAGRSSRGLAVALGARLGPPQR